MLSGVTVGSVKLFSLSVIPRERLWRSEKIRFKPLGSKKSGSRSQGSLSEQLLQSLNFKLTTRRLTNADERFIVA
jgi:hypothetical protein